jgi:hypothetical protein
MQTRELTPLDYARAFAGRLVYATPEQLDALTLLVTVSHVINCFTTVPRGLAVSDEPGSGKSTVLHFARMLGWRAWSGTNATEPAIKAKFIEGECTLIVDEISKLFGESGMNGKNSKLYQLLVSGYESGATTAFSAGRVTEDVPIYGVAVAAGLRKAAPDDLRSRSVIWQMKPAPPAVAEALEDALDPSTRAYGLDLGKALHKWARSSAEEMREFAKNGLRGLHPKLNGRRRQVWGPLFAVAHVAGSDWPARCLRAFLDLALDSGERPVLVPEEQVLLDAADFTGQHGTEEGWITSRDLLTWLKGTERELYWPMSDRALGKLMTATLGATRAERCSFVYPQPEDEGKVPVHKGWFMAEHLLHAADLRAQLNLVLHEKQEPDDIDMMFE